MLCFVWGTWTSHCTELWNTLNRWVIEDLHFRQKCKWNEILEMNGRTKRSEAKNTVWGGGGFKICQKNLSDTAPFKRWTLILLFLSVGCIYLLASNKIKCDGTDDMWLLRLSPTRHCGFVLSLGSPALGEASSHIMRMIKQPYRESNKVRYWGLLPTAVWVSHLGIRYSSPSQAFRWLYSWTTSCMQPHERPWTRPPS